MQIFKIFSVLIFFLFLTSCGSSKNYSIVTSKEDALNKGIYNTNFQNKRKIAKSNSKTIQLKNLNQNKKGSKNKRLYFANKKLSDFKRDSLASVIQEEFFLEKELELHLKSTLVKTANEYLGTPYRFGGNSKNGIDCSAFVRNVFDEIDYNLPRTSFAQSQIGDKIKRGKAKTGDLIFFKTNHRRIVSHVGMVLNNFDGEIFFIHASSSKGVIISSLEESYYAESYSNIQRVLEY